MADIKFNTMLYGEISQTPTNNNQQQVKFVITGATSKGQKGTAGSGFIEFNRTERVIYVDGVKYGVTDALGNDIAEFYATKADTSANVDWLDASVQRHLDASVTALEQAMYQNQSNLRLFKTIGGVDASSNSATLDLIGSDGLTISHSDSSIIFTIDTATAEKKGAIKSGADITVDGTSSLVTVQKIHTYDVSNGTFDLVAASGSGASQTLKTIRGLKVVDDGEGNLSIRYTGKYSDNTDLATKANVDAVIGAAQDGMHFRGTLEDASIAALPATPKVGDFYIASVSENKTIGEGETAQTVETGDYLVYTQAGWKVINRNFTTTSTVTDGQTTSALIPTEGAVITFVNNQIAASTATSYWLKAIKVGDTSVIADSSNDTFEFAAGTDINITTDGKKITFTHADVNTSKDSSVEDKLELTSGTDEFTVITNVKSSATGHITGLVSRTIDVAGAVTSRISNTAEKSTSTNTTFSQSVLSQTLFWEVVE